MRDLIHIDDFTSDCGLLHERTTRRPRSDARSVLSDIHAWTVSNESDLSDLLGLR